MFTKTDKGTFRINGSFTVSEIANVLLENSGDYFKIEGQPLTSPDATRDFLKAALSHHESEVFGVIFMDNRHRVQAF